MPEDVLIIPKSPTNWKTLRIIIRGVTPLLMHNPSQMRRAETMARKTIPSPEEEAEAGLYRFDTGELYIKADHVREAMKAAAVGVRFNRKAAKPVLAAAVMEHPDYPRFLLTRDGEPITTWDIDTRRAVVQRQGILRSRPVVRLPWQATCVFIFDVGVVADPAPLVATMMQAGQTSGLLDYRPSKGGSFGRFEVIAASAEE